jgi:hypothetical protein
MGASLHLATSNNTVPTAGDDGCIDLTSLTVADWVRAGGKADDNNFITLGIDEFDQMNEWQITGNYPSGHPSSQSPTYSRYNVVTKVLPQKHLFNIKFGFLGRVVEIQETDSKGKKRWARECSLPLDHVPTRAAQSALLKQIVRFEAYIGSQGSTWPVLLDHYFDMLETALDKLVIEREDLMDQENIDE